MATGNGKDPPRVRFRERKTRDLTEQAREIARKSGEHTNPGSKAPLFEALQRQQAELDTLRDMVGELAARLEEASHKIAWLEDLMSKALAVGLQRLSGGGEDA